MDFDAVLVNHIGEFGRYQKCMFMLMLCVSITVAFHTFIHTFTGVNPDGLVYVRNPLNESNLQTNSSKYENSLNGISQSLYCLQWERLNGNEKHDFEIIDNATDVVSRANNGSRAEIYGTSSYIEGYDFRREKSSSIVLEVSQFVILFQDFILI